MTEGGGGGGKQQECTMNFVFVFRTHADDLNGANDGRVKHGNLYGNVNTGYQHDGQQATPMVTFNPAHTPGIAINDSSSTKVRSSLFLVRF